ncbi:hypothetical protein BDK51DRAFT_26788, partial [Blyttiomyces helicus]
MSSQIQTVSNSASSGPSGPGTPSPSRRLNSGSQQSNSPGSSASQASFPNASVPRKNSAIAKAFQGNNSRSRRQEPRGVVKQDLAPRALGSPNKRGEISLNHLLNFSLPPRQAPSMSAGPVRRRKGSSYEPYNKERFVNANFRFIMRPTGDYTVNLFDPDVFIQWPDIAQAIVPVATPPSCPICLCPPTAAKVTKCGHVYCWTCILHYLHLGEKKWRKCPICYDAIYAKDLKSAKFWVTGELGLGRASVRNPVGVKLALVKRRMNSTVVLPRSVRTDSLTTASTSTTASESPPLISNRPAVPFAKLLLSTPEHSREVFAHEKSELLSLLSEADQEDMLIKAVGGGKAGEQISRGGMRGERPFIESALREVE